jgi:hypothetical protein
MARDVLAIAIVSEAAHSSNAPDAAALPREGNILSMLALRATPVRRYCFGRPSVYSPASAFLGSRTSWTPAAHSPPGTLSIE